jgi:hypothetical protein
MVKKMHNGMFAIMSILVVFTHTPIITIALSVGVMLSGQVTDYDGKPLDVIHIKVEASDGVVYDRVLDLKPGGMVSVSLGEVKQDSVRCYISSDGFEPTEITAVVQGNHALLGTVKLKRYLDLGPIEVLKAADGQGVYLDFWITSKSSRPHIIRQVGIKGEEVRQGPCFDSIPRISFHFKNIGVSGNSKNTGKPLKLIVSVLVEPEGKKGAEGVIQVEGTFHRDQCGPSVVTLVAPYSFSIESGERDKPIKLRITVPRQLRLRGVGTVRPDWNHALIFITLDNGETISAEAGR